MSNRPVKFGLILSNTERSIHYFNYLKLKKLTPSIVLLYSDQKILPNLLLMRPNVSEIFLLMALYQMILNQQFLIWIIFPIGLEKPHWRSIFL